MTTRNVSYYGAVGDGASDDRAAIQSALDASTAGDFVWLSEDRYLVGQGAGAWCLRIPAGVRFGGTSRDTVLQQSGGVPGSVRTLQVEGNGVTVQHLTLDGNKANQTADEHRAGVFVAAADVTIYDVVAKNFTGDGLYFYHGSDRFVVDACACSDNDRNGLTLGGMSTGGKVVGSQFTGSRAQQFDSEPGATSFITDLRVSRCLFDGLGATDFVLTVSGSAPTSRSERWVIEDCTINGGVNVVWCSGIRMRRNKGTNTTAKPHVRVFRSCSDITIEDNELQSNTANANGVVHVVGTGEGGASRVVIRRNRLYGDVFGIAVEGAISVYAHDNEIIGRGIPLSGGAGLYVRATVPTRPIASAIFRRNTIRDFGQLGMTVWGNGTSRIDLLDVSDSLFDDQAGTMTGALALNYDGSGAARDVRVGGNILLGGCTTEIVSAPPGAPTQVTSQRWLVP